MSVGVIEWVAAFGYVSTFVCLVYCFAPVVFEVHVPWVDAACVAACVHYSLALGKFSPDGLVDPSVGELVAA